MFNYCLMQTISEKLSQPGSYPKEDYGGPGNEVEFKSLIVWASCHAKIAGEKLNEFSNELLLCTKVFPKLGTHFHPEDVGSTEINV